jgi:hypothetical protein
MIDYSAAGEYARAVRAFAIVESGENETAIGDGGRAFGLLQMHPATFSEFYLWPDVDDTWTRAQIRACADFLAVQGWQKGDETQRDLIVQAWNLGVHAVFVEGRRNPEYLARWRKAWKEIA